VTDSAEMLNTKKRKSRDENQPPYDFKNIESLVSLVEAASYFQLPELAKRGRAWFDRIWLHLPCLSLAILQALKMAGPGIALDLKDTALNWVRVLPFETITADRISSVCAHVLETVLKDEKMEMTEYELFQILQLWMEAVGGSPSAQSDRRATAADFSKYIFFEKIDHDINLPRTHQKSFQTCTKFKPLGLQSRSYRRPHSIHSGCWAP
jgi:hypothetical protein